MSNRRRPRSDAPRRRRKRRSRRPWHAPSGSMRKDTARDARGHSPPPGGCTICDDRLAWRFRRALTAALSIPP
jgi:hypothetical protein